MKQSIEDETSADKMMLDDAHEIIMSPILYTEITDKSMDKLPLFKLDDLFLNYDDIQEEQRKRNQFRVRFYCLRIDPQDPKEVVQAFDPDTMETFSCQDLEGEDEATCKSSGKKAKFMYRMQMLVKD